MPPHSIEEFATFSVPATTFTKFVAMLIAHKKFCSLFDVKGDIATGVITILTNAPIGDGSYARQNGLHLYEEKSYGRWLLQIVGDIASSLCCNLSVSCRVSRYDLGSVTVTDGVISKNTWVAWDRRPGADLPFGGAL